MAFTFKSIDRVESLSKKEFMDNYYKPQRPVVIENLTENWAAKEKWSLAYLKKIAGDKIVPLYDNEPVKAEDGFNEPKAKMKFSEYVDLLEAGPTDLRIFLYNLIKEVPELREDFEIPDLGLPIMKGLPMLFFGGENSNVFMHYDIDLANIFHFHFHGKKECVIIPPEQTKYMYKIPHSTICREDINFDEPDFEQWPALKNITPYRAELTHGQMLYMPEGWWHYMKYLTPSFSMSLRSIARKPKYFAEAVYNVFVMRHYDGLMRKIQGQKWIDSKNELAYKRTNRRIQNLHS